MPARLGNVLYWMGCILAALILICFQILASNENPDSWGLASFGLAFAVVSWLAGRAVLHPRGHLAGPRASRNSGKTPIKSFTVGMRRGSIFG